MTKEVGFQAVSHVRRQCTEVPKQGQGKCDTTCEWSSKENRKGNEKEGSVRVASTLYQDAIDATRMHICDGDAARAVLVAGWVGVTSICSALVRFICLVL
jgi:hypothetical protein